ncbi:hypothetical protein ANCCEY_04036 [Ancylostoma ceylanicum]|uniref:Peptidase S9A N-terminal domain-containing protein n=1 Tax=Ancylostoma ceylanicum TaxID=53326 RepID=A0A0D6LXZ3_9BILA|nr:hypothetical protein ANCCEY_04036 [Ancylostoma ceylanicum]
MEGHYVLIMMDEDEPQSCEKGGGVQQTDGLNRPSFRDADRRDLSDVVKGVRSSQIAWLKDNSGFFYSKYPYTKDLEGKSAKKLQYHSLYFHLMGTDSDKDVLIYDRRENGDYRISGGVTEDGKYLIIYVASSDTPYNTLHYQELGNSEKIGGRITPRTLFDKFDALYEAKQKVPHNIRERKKIKHIEVMSTPSLIAYRRRKSIVVKACVEIQ